MFQRGGSTTKQSVFDAPTMAGSCPSQVQFRSAEKGEKASGIQWWLLTGVMHLNGGFNGKTIGKP